MNDSVLTMIPGPTPVHPRILAALAEPTVSHVSAPFVAAYGECLESIKKIVFAEAAQPFIVAGSGTLAMEMALVNLVTPQRKLLVVSQGFFGDRWAQIADAFGIPCDLVKAEWGSVVAVETLNDHLESGSYAAVALTHVDTSTGSAGPIEAYCNALRGRDEMVLLDGVCATAGIEERFDNWGLDLLITGAQKALGAPPGLALALASPRAMEARKARAAVPAYSADMLRWIPIMQDPSRYFSTPPVNEILSLREALRIVLEEGLERRFERHRRIAAAIRAGLNALGLRLFTEEHCRADTLSVVCYPKGIGDAAFRCEMERQQVIVAGALGPIAGQAFRIGHMGNIGSAEVRRTLQAIEGSLIRLGSGIERGTAVSAAETLLGAVD